MKPLSDLIMKRVLLPFLAAASFNPLAAQGAESWIEVRTPHFFVVSDAGVKAARNVADEFEQFRAVIQKALPKMSLDPGQPVIIFALKNQKSLRRLVPQFWEDQGAAKPAGVFLGGPERHYVAIRLDVPGRAPFRIVYHEYFHVLASLNWPKVPLWVNEGLAEFYAQTVISPEDVGLGLPNEDHVRLLSRRRLLPLEVLFSVDEHSPYYNAAENVSIFYSQSWALVHYLVLRDPHSGDNPLNRLIGLLHQGVDEERALKRALGDFERLEQSLETYLKSDEFYYYRFPRPLEVDSSDFAIRELTPAESASLRASFLVRNERPREASKLIEQALERDPGLAPAYESLGYLRYREEQFAAALQAFEKAVQLNSDSYLSHYYFAYLKQRLEESTSVEVEQSLRRAIQLRPTFAFSYASLAHLYLRRGEHLDQALSLAQSACRLDPSNPSTLRTLGYALLKHERIEEAQEIASRIWERAQSESDREVARLLEKDIAEFKRYYREKRRYEAALEEIKRETRKGSKDAADPPLETQGTIVTARCSAPASLDIILKTGQGYINLVSYNFTTVLFYSADPTSALELDPCEDIKGHDARILYRVDEDGERKRIVAVYMQ